MALFTEGSRSKFESTAYTVLLLAFFFAVGLAGGVLYRLLPGPSGTQVASREKPIAAPTAQQATESAATKVSTPAPEVPAPVLAAARPASPAKPASAPTKPAAVASTTAASAATSQLPSIASPAALPAPQPAAAEVAPATSEPTSVATVVVPASGQVSATLPAAPAPSSTAPSDTAAGPSGAGAKPPVSTAKPATSGSAKAKAPPEKRVALAAPPRPTTQAAPSEAASGHVRIQFGAFTVEDNAHQIQSAVEATGLGTELSQVTTPKGRVIYFVRSHLFPDRAAALAAASAAQAKAKTLADPVAIDFFIVGDTAAPGQQAQAASH